LGADCFGQLGADPKIVPTLTEFHPETPEPISRAARLRKRSRARQTARASRLSKADIVLVAVPLLSIYLGHLAYGALMSNAALLMTMCAAAAAGWAVLDPTTRARLVGLKGVAAPSAALAVTLAAVLASLIPNGPAASLDRSTTLIELVKLLGLACLFATGAGAGGSRRRARLAIWLSLLLGAIFAAWAFVASMYGAAYETQAGRLEARFLNPNTAGTLFAALLMLTVSAAISRRFPPRYQTLGRGLLVSAGLLFLVCMLMTASRGAVLAALVGLALLVAIGTRLAGQRAGRGAAWLAAGGLVLAFAAVFAAGDFLTERFFHVEQSADLRGDIWRAHWGAFLLHPVFGQGLGTSETVNKLMLNRENFTYLWNIRAILSVYLQWLEQAGLVGALAMFATVGSVMFQATRNLLASTRARWAIAGLLAVDVVFIAHGAVDFALETPSMAAFFAYVLGLQFALGQRCARR
jgi:O-antigen ligase